MNQTPSLLDQAIQSHILNLRAIGWKSMSDAELRRAFGSWPEASAACLALSDYARSLVQHSEAIEELSDRILVACRTTIEGA
jgi:hypothetical protein